MVKNGGVSSAKPTTWARRNKMKASYEFAGKTPTGSKIHRAWSRHESACWQYTSNKMMYFTAVKGKVKRENLCIKCWGFASAEYLAEFGLELY
jgi:hypothetical protein